MRSAPISEKEAYLRASTLCAKGEMCSFDIAEKFKKWGLDKCKSDKLIDQLIDERFIDDSRYAKAYCNDKWKYQKWGRNKIAYSLRMKKIPNEAIDNALTYIDGEIYEQQLFDAIKYKLKSLKDKDKYQQRASLYRFAVSRGYESSLISKVLSKLQFECEDYYE